MSNRHQRRAQRAILRHAPPDSFVGGHRWTQRVDPTDPAFVLIEFRMPNGGMPPATYTGLEASDRLLRFCEGYLQGRKDSGTDFDGTEDEPNN